MRWFDLFADLEAEARGWRAADRDAEVADRTRGELARIRLEDRLRQALGSRLSLHVTGVGDLDATLLRVGADWALVESGCEAMLPLGAIEAVRGLAWDARRTALDREGGGVGVVVSGVEAALPLRTALRALARDRSALVAQMRSGRRLTGTPNRVGADWLELAEHDLDEAPRLRAVRAQVAVPFSSLAMVTRQPPGWA